MIYILAWLISALIWAGIFWILFWLAGKVALGEPFNKVILIILCIAAAIVAIGLLTGSIAPFPITGQL